MGKTDKKIIKWLLSEDTGLSSKSICRWMLGLGGSFYAPSDAGDRGRCIRLLNLIPEWWDRLDEMSHIPSAEITVFSGGKMQTRYDGWKEQIPLIKDERNNGGRLK